MRRPQDCCNYHHGAALFALKAIVAKTEYQQRLIAVMICVSPQTLTLRQPASICIHAAPSLSVLCPEPDSSPAIIIKAWLMLLLWCDGKEGTHTHTQTGTLV